MALRLVLEGRVQGVGFRPFVYRCAHGLGVRGWVLNGAGRVEIRAEADAATLERFQQLLIEAAPPLARPVLVSSDACAPQDFERFEIRASIDGARPRIHVPPDQFACDDCLQELLDPAQRRHRYPFTNCTQCGPRYTLIRRMPYDRPNTTLAEFELCNDCRSEYENPLDRRFHAQPLACPRCGPKLLWQAPGEPSLEAEAALERAVTRLQQGAILAVRGIGGYHLMCDAGNDEAVRSLRERKRRPHKPLAVMVPQSGPDGLAAVKAIAAPEPSEAEGLIHPTRPIVLLRRRDDAPSGLSREIAPGLGEIGLMLPYSPLHHLLLEDFGGPLVATSGNISGEPVITDPQEAERRLRHVADAFLHHDRPICRPADDPVLRPIAGALRPLRLGRGTAPLELALPVTCPEPLLALGSFLKTTVALAWEDRVVISPHIGDQETPRSREVLWQVAEELQALYGVKAALALADAHPDDPSARAAEKGGLPVQRVFHHHAHAAAVAGEFGVEDPMLCFTWDGTGFGVDGSVWGGELLQGRAGAWRRVGSLRTFRPPGGDRAAREGWRSALALAWELGEAPGEEAQLRLLHQAWDRGINAPVSQSAGRLFDAAAALSGCLTSSTFEGQAPMAFEALCDEDFDPDAPRLPLDIDEAGLQRIDWSPLLPMLRDEHLTLPQRSCRFHSSLARALADQAERVARSDDVWIVGLCGGVFQNRRLAVFAKQQLEARGFRVLIPRKLPCNDAGISYGQVLEYLYRGAATRESRARAP